MPTPIASNGKSGPDAPEATHDCDETPIRVFVHLAHGLGAIKWEQRWKEGRVIGINEPLPYGYHRARDLGCSVEYSRDSMESAVGRLIRLGVRAILGFDLIHAWYNFERLCQADVVWTHTESQYLSILLLLKLLPRERRPKLIAQTVWLVDRWNRTSFLKRSLYSWLISDADVLTFLSPENLRVARQLFPQVRSQLVRFGISIDQRKFPQPRSFRHQLQLISIGNDEHRDWKLLINVIASRKQWTLRIASTKIDRGLLVNASNIEIVRLRSNDELMALYDWADVLVLAIKPNLHASGITVIQEAALRGVPVICTDTGGLQAYFTDSELQFVRPQDDVALQRAIDTLAADRDKRLAMARGAQVRMSPADLSSQAYVRQHVELSRDLLGRLNPAGYNAYADS
jgi:glycosyltransferase involved in cell wall biosynthesis